MKFNDHSLSWFHLGLGLILFASGLVYCAVFAPKAIVALYAIGVGGFCFLNLPQFSLYLVIIGAFFDETHISVGVALLGGGDLGLLIFLPSWFFKKLYTRSPWRLPTGWGFLIGYLTLTALSLVLGERPHIAYGQYVRLCVYVLALFAFVDEVRSLQEIERSLWTFVGCGLVHAIVAQIIANPNARYVGLVGQPNLLGFLIGISLVVLWSFLSEFSLPSKWKASLLGGGLIGLLTLLLTVSRGSYLSMLGGLTWLYRKQWRWALGMIVVFGLSITLIEWLDPDRLGYISHRLRLDDQSVSNRKQVMLNALRLIQERPFFGIGFGQFGLIEAVVQVNAEAGRGSHNYYLGLCASSGLLAASCIFMFVLTQFYGLMLASRKLHSENRFKEWVLVNTLQGMFIFHSISLTFRGSKRITEWIPLALYATMVLYISSPPLSRGSQNHHESTP